jgi:hypothetical protein
MDVGGGEGGPAGGGEDDDAMESEPDEGKGEGGGDADLQADAKSTADMMRYYNSELRRRELHTRFSPHSSSSSSSSPSSSSQGMCASAVPPRATSEYTPIGRQPASRQQSAGSGQRASSKRQKKSANSQRASSSSVAAAVPSAAMVRTRARQTQAVPLTPPILAAVSQLPRSALASASGQQPVLPSSPLSAPSASSSASSKRAVLLGSSRPKSMRQSLSERIAAGRTGGTAQPHFSGRQITQGYFNSAPPSLILPNPAGSSTHHVAGSGQRPASSSNNTTEKGPRASLSSAAAATAATAQPIAAGRAAIARQNKQVPSSPSIGTTARQYAIPSGQNIVLSSSFSSSSRHGHARAVPPVPTYRGPDQSSSGSSSSSSLLSSSSSLHAFFRNVIPTSSRSEPPVNNGQQKILRSLLQRAKVAEKSGHVGPVFQDDPVYGRDMFPTPVLPDDRCDTDFNDDELASEIEAARQDMNDRQRQQSPYIFVDDGNVSDDDELEEEGNSEEEEIEEDCTM